METRCLTGSDPGQSAAVVRYQLGQADRSEFYLAIVHGHRRHRHPGQHFQADHRRFRGRQAQRGRRREQQYLGPDGVTSHAVLYAATETARWSMIWRLLPRRYPARSSAPAAPRGR